MALNTIVCLAAIIMNLTFLTENICRRLCMRPFALAVTAAAALALANISFRPVGEVCFDLSILALPAFLTAFSLGGGYTARRGRVCLSRLAAISMIPMLISAAISLVNYFADGFAAFDLNEGAIVPWQVLLCGMDMAIGDILLAKKVAV